MHMRRPMLSLLMGAAGSRFPEQRPDDAMERSAAILLMLGILDNITSTYFLYLVYGAVFLFLGVAIAAKDMKGSDLRLADKLWMLGMFGFLHGAHEWLELGVLIEGKSLSFDQIVAEKTGAVVLGLFSFLFLLRFGISLVQGLDTRRTRWVAVLPLPLLLLWFLYFRHFGLHQQAFHVDLQSLRQVDIGARYTFGFSGAAMTAYGLVAYSREVRILSRSASRMLLYAGCTFGFYAVFAGLLSSSLDVPFLPVPVEVLRGVSAFFITYFISKALNIFDIEARKKIEQQARRLIQAEKLTSLGQLAAGIAHEINNPLTNASLGIQTLKMKLAKQAVESDTIQKLDAVERNIDRASAIAQELLQFSRQKESEFVALNVNALIQGALTLMHYQLSRIAVRQELTAVPDILGDPGKLEQVFINIISNSLEAMPDGGELTLTSFPDGDHVSVKMRDTGAGIAPENQSRVFDPFFTTKDVGKGTGLGLSISYGIIRQHRGTIEVTSTPGRGTMVVLKFPRRERYEKDIDRG
jgi:two-component system NtrC family sensor kinase